MQVWAARREEDSPDRELEDTAQEVDASCKAVADSQCSLEQWDHEAAHCQTPFLWVDPWAGPCAGYDVLHDLFQHQNAGGATGAEEDARAQAPPTAAEDHLAVVAVGRAGHRAAERVRRKLAPAVVAEYMEAVAAACICAGHSWDDSSAGAEQAGQGVEAGLDQATAADVVGSLPAQAAGVGQEDTGRGAGARMAVVPAEAVVVDSHRDPVFGSPVEQPNADDLLCPCRRVHRVLLHSDMADTESTHSQAAPEEERVGEDRSCTP